MDSATWGREEAHRGGSAINSHVVGAFHAQSDMPSEPPISPACMSETIPRTLLFNHPQL